MRDLLHEAQGTTAEQYELEWMRRMDEARIPLDHAVRELDDVESAGEYDAWLNYVDEAAREYLGVLRPELHVG